MGFSRSAAMNALHRAGGRLQGAVALLLDGGEAGAAAWEGGNGAGAANGPEGQIPGQGPSTGR